jgi:hypothetical protein
MEAAVRGKFILTAPERKLLNAFRAGKRVHLGGGDAEHGATWGPDRTIRAEVIRALLIEAEDPGEDAVRAVRIDGAHIIGAFDLRFATVRYPLSLRSCYIDTKLDFHGVRCREIDLSSSYIRGGVRASTGYIDGHLLLDNAVVEKSVRLIATHVAGALFMNGTRLNSGTVRPNGPAFEADGLRVDADMLCRDGFSVNGEMRFTGAHIGDTLNLDRAQLTNPDGHALQAARIMVDGDLLCRDGFVAKGELNLDGATVAGQLNMDGATLENRRKYALHAARLTVRGGMRCSTNFCAHGEIHILNARLSGPFVLDGARIYNAKRIALHASGMTAGAMYCRSHFAAEGEIRLSGAHINGPLDFSTAHLSQGASQSLGCWWLTAREVILHFAAPVEGIIDLQYAQVGLLRHSSVASATQARLDGLTYSSIAPSEDIDGSLAWLKTMAGEFQPQPYEQLAEAYRRAGNDLAARKVLLAKERRRRAGSPRPAKAWGYLQDFMVGYGYRSWRAAGWLGALIVAGTMVFSVWRPATVDAGQAPSFNALIYTLDLLVPIIDFGQEKSYLPLHEWQQWFMYGLIAVGWILATTIAAGITRALRRQ